MDEKLIEALKIVFEFAETGFEEYGGMVLSRKEREENFAAMELVREFLKIKS